MYNTQPQSGSQMQYPQAQNADYVQPSSSMDSEKNADEYHYNLDTNGQQEQSTATAVTVTMRATAATEPTADAVAMVPMAASSPRAAAVDVNNSTHTITQSEPQHQYISETLSLDDVIRSSLLDITDLIDM
jgi:hypothetical protein